VWLWVLQFRTDGVWTTEFLPVNQTARTFFSSPPDVIAVSALDRVGNESEPVVLEKGAPRTIRPGGRGTGLDWRRNLNR
jgi:hypothetical protein